MSKSNIQPKMSNCQGLTKREKSELQRRLRSLVENLFLLSVHVIRLEQERDFMLDKVAMAEEVL